MIKHICMFKLKENACGKSREENLLRAAELSYSLSAIPSVVSFEVKTNHSEAPESNYDLALIIDFKDIEGLNAYQIHPVHKEFGKFITAVRDGRACIDYEY